VTFAQKDLRESGITQDFFGALFGAFRDARESSCANVMTNAHDEV